MPEWLVWPSSNTVPVKVPVRESVGDLEQEKTANKTKRTRIHELHEFSRRKKLVRELHEFSRIVFFALVHQPATHQAGECHELARIKERILLMVFICMN